MKELAPDKGLVVFDIRWKTDTAGPSPNNNERVELFLLGCKKAMDGNPCKGCFNSTTWDIGKALFSRDPIEVADKIAEMTDSRYITIGGGEPTDQIEYLIPLCKRLKEHGFHIMMYTWRDLYFELGHTPYDLNKWPYKQVFSVNYWRQLLEHVDIVVDGEFKPEECLYQQDLGDGMLSSIGSGNQRIWDIKGNKKYDIFGNLDIIDISCSLKYAMKDLAGLYIKPDTNDLVYITKE